MSAYACYARNLLILNFYISFVTGSITITTACYGLVSSSLTISCKVDPQITSVTITRPNGNNAAFCTAPLPGLATVCNPIGSYTTVPTKVGNVTTFVLTIPSLDISIHDGNWTCKHLAENSTDKVCVNTPLFPPGKEPTFTATNISAKLISCSGEVYCQHPVSALTFELLYAEENKAYTVLTQQPSASKQNLGSNGCGSEESNVTFSETVSCDNYGSLAGKTFTLMARFNQSNLPPGMNTYNVTSSGSFSCPDVETTTAATTNGSDNDSGLSGGAIAGIVIGVVVVCGVVVCVIFIVKKKKNKEENKKPKVRKSSTVEPIDTPEKKNGKWVEPNAQTAERYSANSVTSRTDVVVDVQETKTNQGDNSEKRITPRDLPPIPAKDSVTNDQEEKRKIKKKKKKKKEAKQEQNQQQEEGKDNTAFDNDQTENIPSDDTGNLETKTTPSNNDNLHSDDLGDPETTTPNNNDNLHSDDLGDPETTTPNNNDNIPSDDPANPETKTTPSNNINVPSDDLGSPETKTTLSNNDNTPSDDTGNLETKTTPSNIDSIPSDDLANLETNTSSYNHTIPNDDPANPKTTTPSNNHNIPSDDSGNPETTTPSNNHNIPSDDSGNPEKTTPSNIDS